MSRTCAHTHTHTLHVRKCYTECDSGLYKCHPFLSMKWYSFCTCMVMLAASGVYIVLYISVVLVDCGMQRIVIGICGA